MRIAQVDTHNKHQVRHFLELPFRIYQDIPQWVPPFVSDIRRMLDRRHHPFYRHSTADFFLAYNEAQRPIGRIAVLEHRRYNLHNNERSAFFYLFECEQNPLAAHTLFQTAFEWAHRRGLEKIIGPKGFSVLDGMGLLIHGFDHRPAFGQPYNPPYYSDFIEKEGFIPAGDVVSGYLDASLSFPEKIHQMSAVIQKRRGLQVAIFKKRKDLQLFVSKLKDLYNSSLTSTSGTFPLTDEEVRAMANQILWFADPRLIKIILKGTEPVGFLLAYPDISAALQRNRGRLFPFGWLDCLVELRRTRWININGAGILPQYRGLGGTAILFSEMYKSVAASRYRYAELVQIGAENNQMLRELRGLGVDFYKTHRLYERSL